MPFNPNNAPYFSSCTTAKMIYWFLLGFLFLVPVPLASNRPVFYLFDTLVIGIVAIIYILSLATQAQHPKIAPVFKIILTIALVYLGIIILQSIDFNTTLRVLDTKNAHIGPLAFDTISFTPNATQIGLLRTIGYVVFFFLLANTDIISTKNIHCFAEKLTVVFVAHALFGLINLKWFGNLIPGYANESYLSVATGVFVNRNSYATFLAFGIVLSMAMALKRALYLWPPSTVLQATAPPYKHNGLYFAWHMFGLFILAYTLVITQSRLGIAVGCLGGLVVLFLTMWQWSKLSVPNIWKISLGCITSLVVIGVFAFVWIESHVIHRIDALHFDASMRLLLYKQTWAMIQEKPWLGYGLDSFGLIFPLFHKADLPVDLLWDKTHSTYLTLWVEMGLVGGILPLLMGLICILFITKNIIDHTNHNVYNANPIIGLSVIYVGALHSLFDFSLEIPANVYVFIALIGLGLRTTNQTKT